MKEKHIKVKKEQEELQETENEQEKIIEELKLEVEKYKDEFLRAHAEMENLRKRQAQELVKNSKYAISSFAKDILFAADNLSRALQIVSEEDKQKLPDNAKSLIQGIEMTERELQNILSKNGVKKISGLGEIFNPNFHQVIQEVEDKTKPSGTIIQELQSGYMINDRILREAMVVVTKGGQKPLEPKENINIET